MKVDEINKLEDKQNSIKKWISYLMSTPDAMNVNANSEGIDRIIKKNIEKRRTKVRTDKEIVEEILDEYSCKVDRLNKLNDINNILNAIKEKGNELSKLLDDINNGYIHKVDMFHSNADETKQMLYGVVKAILSITDDTDKTKSFSFNDGTALTSLLNDNDKVRDVP